MSGLHVPAIRLAVLGPNLDPLGLGLWFHGYEVAVLGPKV